MPDLNTYSSGQLITAANHTKDNTEVTQVFTKGIEDENVKNSGLTLSLVGKIKTVVMALLEDGIATALADQGELAFMAGGTSKDTSGADPYWWPCDGTQIVSTSTGGWANYYTPNMMNPGNPNPGYLVRGVVASPVLDAVDPPNTTGTATHNHTGSSGAATFNPAAAGQTVEDYQTDLTGDNRVTNHNHTSLTINPAAIDPVGTQVQIYIKIR